MSAALRAAGLCKRFGEFRANDGVSLEIASGARHALIGPNGAGKTTLVNLLTGVYAPSSGDVYLGSERITPLAQHQRVQRGLARTFQINQLFADLTPLETIALAVSERLGSGRDGWRRLGTQPRLVDEAAEILERFNLIDVMDEPTALLPYGKQRMLVIATAIASEPRVLLLDEPAAGVPEEQRYAILDTVAALPSDVTVLLIEHDMDVVFKFAQRITVLVNGALFAEGTPQDIAADPRVREVYLGEAAHG